MRTTAHAAAFATWRASVLRSVEVMKSLGIFVAKGKSAPDVVRETNKLISHAACAEMVERIKWGEFDGLPPDPGVISKDAYNVRLMGVHMMLERAGWTKSVSRLGGHTVLVYKRGSEEIAIDSENEWTWYRDGQVISGADLRSLEREVMHDMKDRERATAP